MAFNFYAVFRKLPGIVQEVAHQFGDSLRVDVAPEAVLGRTADGKLYTLLFKRRTEPVGHILYQPRYILVAEADGKCVAFHFLIIQQLIHERKQTL